MPTTSWKYLPILKWKRGEQDAFRYLSTPQSDEVIPLIEVQPQPGTLANVADVTAEQIEHCVHVATVAVEPIYLLEGSIKPIEQLATFCHLLQQRLENHRVIPVIHGALVESLAGSSQRTRDILKGVPEVIIRLRADLIDPDQVAPSVQQLRDIGIRGSHIHLLVDQFSLVGADPVACDKKIRPYLMKALAEKCASVTVSGGSFPINLMGLGAGTFDFPRVEWKTWTLLQKSKQFSEVRYSDYAVTNPSKLEDIDPKRVNPSISIRYAADDFWRVFKGGGFKKGKPGTLRDLCELLISDPVYSGPTFSFGDDSYYKTTQSSKLTNGVPWTWRRDATNHHIVLAAEAL